MKNHASSSCRAGLSPSREPALTTRTVSSRGLGTGQTGSSNDLGSLRAARWRDFWWVAAVGAITAALCAPFICYVWDLGDEGSLLNGAERMLRGEKIYIDFFEFLPPGGFMIMEGWFGIAGISLLSARVLAILTITGISCFTYLACRQASKDAQLSALIAVGWTIVSQGDWTQSNHHWFTTLFSMMVVWITLASVEHARPWLLGPLTAGIAVGAAVMVTPNLGALVMLAAATAFLNFRQYRSELLTYTLASALIPICLIVYMVEHNALMAGIDDVILATASRYTFLEAVPFGLWAPFHLRWIFPLAALIALLTCIRDWRNCLHGRMFRTCVAFGLAGFIACFPRPDMFHIACSSPLVCPLLAYGVNRLVRPWPVKYQYVVAALAIASLIPSARWFWMKSEEALYGDIVPMPRGAITSPVHGLPGLAARIAATPPGDPYFFYPYDAILPFLTARQHMSRYDIFLPSWTVPSQYQEACVSAIRGASWVVIDREFLSPKRLKAVYPALRDPNPREKAKFEQALETGFELVAREGLFELRRRVPGVDETLCSGITSQSLRAPLAGVQARLNGRV
jgi:hypothetical protein